MSSNVHSSDMSDYPQFSHAAGSCVCYLCGLRYDRHRYSHHLDWNGNRWLVELCDGRLVKL